MAEKNINYKINVDTGESVKNIDKVTQSTDKLQDKSKETGASLDNMTGGRLAKFKGLITGLKSTALGFKSVGFAIAASGLGLVVIAISAITAAFKNSEAGQNKFAKLMGVIGSITGNLIDILSSLGEKLIWVFTNPKQAISDFANSIKTNIVNRFNGLLELIPSLGKAVKQLFEGDFANAAETAANAAAKVALGVEDLTGKIDGAADALKKLANEVADDAKKAAKIADDRAKADILERDLILEKAEAEREIANLRLKAEQKNTYSAEQRKAFLQEAGNLQENLIKKEQEALKLRAEAIKLENTLSGSNKDDLQAEVQAQAAVIQKGTELLAFKRTLATKLVAVDNETNATYKANRDAKAAADNKLIEDEKKRAEGVDAFMDALQTEREDKAAETEQQKLDLKRERQLQELEDLKANEVEKREAVKAIDEAYDIEKKELEAAAKEEQAIKDEEQRVADALAREKRIQADRDERDGKIDNANKYLASVEMLANRESAIGKAVQAAKIAMRIINMVNRVKDDIAEAKSSAQRATVKATEGVLNTAVGYSKAAATLNPAIIAGYAVTAAGIIASIASALKASSSATKQGGGVSLRTPQAPQEVSYTPEKSVNQLIAESNANIATNTEKQMRAYVVSGDVTTAQELERNIIEDASI